MSNFSTSSSQSQVTNPEVEPLKTVNSQLNPETVRQVLFSCDKDDLLIICHIGKNPDREVSDIMQLLRISNSTANINLRKLCGDPKVRGLSIPILCRSQTGPKGAFVHSLNNGVTLEVIETVMADKGISYEQYLANQQVQDGNLSQSQDQSGIQLPNSLLKAEVEEDFCNSDLKQETETSSAERNFGTKDSNSLAESISANHFKTEELKEQTVQNSLSSFQTGRSKIATIEDVLKMFETTTEIIADQFNKKIAELEARIVELERRPDLYGDSQAANTNHTDETNEILRSSVLSKLGGFSSKPNGNS